MAPLNSFGSIFTFAIQMESDIRDYYQSLGKVDEAKEADKRRQKLERARREYVVEITLEPIEDLDESDYEFNLEDKSEAGQEKITATAQKFYSETAPKINVRQAQRILEKCGKQYGG